MDTCSCIGDWMGGVTMDWIARELLSRPVVMSTPLRRRTPNPRPPGVIQPGSVSDAVLKHLRIHPKRWHRTAEIVRAVGRSAKTVSWALHFLRVLGHIQAIPCGGPAVSCRYLKYRVSGAVHDCSDSSSARGRNDP
jgi:hypothetical protein